MKATELDCIFKENFSCQLSNFVYVFLCPKCKSWYTGETGNFHIPRGPDIRETTVKSSHGRSARPVLLQSGTMHLWTGKLIVSAALAGLQTCQKVCQNSAQDCVGVQVSCCLKPLTV